MKRKRKYTEAVHAGRVKRVIEKERPGNHCPAGRKFEIGPIYKLWEAPRGDEIPEIKKPCSLYALSFWGCVTIPLWVNTAPATG